MESEQHVTADVREPICEHECNSSVPRIFQLVIAKVWHTVQLSEYDT